MLMDTIIIPLCERLHVAELSPWQGAWRNYALWSKRCWCILIVQVVIGVGVAKTSVAADVGVTAVSADVFLSSLGVNTHVDQGVSGGSYITPLRYLGVRNIRDLARHWPQFQLINRQTGVRLDLAGEGDLDGTISVGKALAATGALMAFEGPNEPNNFPITYNGQTGGGKGSWSPVAQFQEALYRAVKSSPDLRDYPVFAVSEAGAETDNVGLQFLKNSFWGSNNLSRWNSICRLRECSQLRLQHSKNLC